MFSYLRIKNQPSNVTFNSWKASSLFMLPYINLWIHWLKPQGQSSAIHLCINLFIQSTCTEHFLYPWCCEVLVIQTLIRHGPCSPSSEEVRSYKTSQTKIQTEHGWNNSLWSFSGGFMKGKVDTWVRPRSM